MLYCDTDPDKGDLFGLTFVQPRFVRTVTVTGSRDLSNVMSGIGHDSSTNDEDDDVLGDGQSWRVYTMREGGAVAGLWEPRKLVPVSRFGQPRGGHQHQHQQQEDYVKVSAVPSTGSSSDVYQVKFALEPIVPTARERAASRAAAAVHGMTVDENGDYVEEVGIRKIKFVSTGRKRDRLKVCGFELDGWKV